MVTLAICAKSIPAEVVELVVIVGPHGLLQVTDVVVDSVVDVTSEVVVCVVVTPADVVCDEVGPGGVTVATLVGVRVVLEATVTV